MKRRPRPHSVHWRWFRIWAEVAVALQVMMALSVLFLLLPVVIPLLIVLAVGLMRKARAEGTGWPHTLGLVTGAAALSLVLNLKRLLTDSLSLARIGEGCFECWGQLRHVAFLLIVTVLPVLAFRRWRSSHIARQAAQNEVPPSPPPPIPAGNSTPASQFIHTSEPVTDRRTHSTDSTIITIGPWVRRTMRFGLALAVGMLVATVYPWAAGQESVGVANPNPMVGIVAGLAAFGFSAPLSPTGRWFLRWEIKSSARILVLSALLLAIGAVGAGVGNSVGAAVVLAIGSLVLATIAALGAFVGHRPHGQPPAER